MIAPFFLASARPVLGALNLSRTANVKLRSSPFICRLPHVELCGIQHQRALHLQQKQHSTSTPTAMTTPTPPPNPSTNKKTSVMDVIKICRQGQRKITMVTAYDYPSSVHVCRAGIDVLLVGDSVGMVELGYDTTQPVTVEDMLHHCKVWHEGVYSSEGNTWRAALLAHTKTLVCPSKRFFRLM